MQSRYFTGIVVCLFLGVGAILLFLLTAPHQKSPEESVFAPNAHSLQPPSTISITPIGPHRQPPGGFLEYYNSKYRFSLFYPNDLSVSELDEGGGASTITFQNTHTVQGFQIFVAPYGASQVNEEQFKKDAPSGVRKGLQNVVIDGATGASFYSTSPALGDTAEVWFVHGGFLFEVTTLKSLTFWLSGIVESWKFL